MNKTPDFRVLVVDDNPAIHQDFIKILSSLSSNSELDQLSEKIFGDKSNKEVTMPVLQIDTALQGQEGVAKTEKALKEGNPYSVAFVDIRMPPGWDGIETIKHMWQVDKDIQVVICTAYSDYSWEETVTNLGQTDNLLILKKPFDNVAVRQLACALTKKWKLLQEHRDYTQNLEQKVADRTNSLQQSLSLVKATLESSNDGILVVDKSGNVVDYNQNFIKIWQLPKSVLDHNNEDNLLQYMKERLKNSDDFYNEFHSLCCDTEATRMNLMYFKDGRIFEYYTQPQRMNDLTVGRIFDFRDITKRAQLEEKLHHQATHDYLTGLANRVLLIDKLHQEIHNSEISKAGFALLFIDLDRFKTINDSLSHSMGDELLRAVAARLQSCIDPNDMLARIGGDEFVIILTDAKNEDRVAKQARKFLELFNEPFKIEGREITITVSIGISFYPKNGNTVDALLKNADIAMYRAKDLKGATYQVYSTEMSKDNLDKLDQEIALRKAIDHHEFVLCYQPQFNLETEELIAVEALLRWNHPEKGLLLPDVFVPLAEETGLITSIGEWVLLTACKQAKEWERLYKKNIRMCVNVAPQQLKMKNLVETIQHVLNETKLKPEFLELELTENIIINDNDIINVINKLKAIGVSIAVDDFGTGYTSLGYLKKIPLDRLKIDKSFIQRIKAEGDDEVIIRAIIAIAKNLNLEVIAEGVENIPQLDFLKKHECGDVQGYYFSKPLSLQEMDDLLTKK